ncbi:allophanate hydrolase subunit 1 [Lentisphaera marina]|uniref:5-oxoprolinase subunit B family protein n=1 Tax=Lentisphaera marina TaxID=1111041 RepID=UPI002365AFE6|nr:allophanate hydrolase subunit 1 [Lentisphaera marina]MDD7986773.1 allophanate hydrolase subunit 1 [Lentisphaera marina]
MKSKPEYQCQVLGDSCLIFLFFDHISTENTQFILSLFRSLSSEKDFLDLVPAYCDIAIHFNPLLHTEQEVRIIVDQHLSKLEVKQDFLEKVHRLAVLYDGADLQRVSELTNLDEKEIVRRHSMVQYRVAMIGFLPYFPYLIGLDPTLQVPRLESPRTKVPAGSVSIAGEQTGIYPSASPGGWNLIGRMNPEKLKNLEPGDKVEFIEVKHEDQL